MSSGLENIRICFHCDPKIGRPWKSEQRLSTFSKLRKRFCKYNFGESPKNNKGRSTVIKKKEWYTPKRSSSICTPYLSFSRSSPSRENTRTCDVKVSEITWLRFKRNRCFYILTMKKVKALLFFFLIKRIYKLKISKCTTILRNQPLLFKESLSCHNWEKQEIVKAMKCC